jgi:hypothetical protein
MTALRTLVAADGDDEEGGNTAIVRLRLCILLLLLYHSSEISIENSTRILTTPSFNYGFHR